MFSKPSISLVAALVVSAGVARAVPEAEFSAVVPTVPNSIEYPQRPLVTRAPKTEGLDEFELERGNPDGVDDVHRGIATKKISDANWSTPEFSAPEIR